MQAADLASEYLGQVGLAFDFRAGEREYRVSIGGGQPNAIGGTNALDHTWGLGGDDTLGGSAENDLLYGDEGSDLLSGNDGQDRLDGGAGGDTLYGGADGDNLLGRGGDDYLDEGPGHSNVDGGEGNDTLVGGLGPDAFVVSPTSGDDIIKDFTAGPGMFDHIALMDLRWEELAFADTATGVRVSWEGGSVLLEGADKADLAQDDFMFANAPDLPPGVRDPDGPAPERPTPSVAGPEVEGRAPGASFDEAADRAIRTDSLGFNFDKYAVFVGSNEANSFSGSAAWDNVFGRGGRDVISGAEGDDILYGDGGRDMLNGGPGADRLNGGKGKDSLVGADQADELMGSDGDDVLDEGAGHGMLEGGRGDDLLTGGSGADAFIVSQESGNDVMTDFEATGLAQGAFDHIAFLDILPEQVIVHDTDQGTLVAWNVDDDNQVDGSILLAGIAKADLRQSDFMFVEEPGFVEGVNDFGSWYIFPGSTGPIA
ncbi:calcium-binding protein [Roseomonas chloroacetimidivorans]|uniref:calcium-binding protein n=1 Tax=Roseomonas chloroacetimidivorans TaxID=1766656 RepID=UPI003C7232C5